MDIQPIHTEAEHRAALRELSAFFDIEPTPGTPEGNRFEALLALVEAYETGDRAQGALLQPDPGIR